MAAQRFGGGLDEEAHEAEAHAVLLLEGLAHLLAHLLDLGQVHLVEGGEHGDAVLGLHQALGDALADAGHRHALFRTRATRQRAVTRTVAHVVDQVFLGDLAVAAAAGDVGRVDAMLGGDAAAGRGQPAGVDRLCGGGRCCRGGSLRGFGLGLGFRRFGRLRRSRAFLDDGDQLLALDGVAFGELELLDDAVHRRGDFQHHLVGFEVDDVFIAGHGVARLLVPGGDGGVGNRFREDGNFDFGAHGRGPDSG